jgi:hypothetical protein
MKVQLAEHVIWRDLGDEVVILSLANNNYFGLVGAGGQMWRHLAETESTDRTVEALMKEFETDAATLRTDLDVLVRELETLGLVIVDGHAATRPAAKARAKAPKASRSKGAPRRAIKRRAAKTASARKRASKKGGAQKRRSRKTNR